MGTRLGYRKSLRARAETGITKRLASERSQMDLLGKGVSG